jgi:hypothetical protein
VPTPKVFISCSHDSSEHKSLVISLSERLRKDGIDAALDQYVPGTPEEGWPRWMLNQLDWADFVLVACTQTYYRRFRGREEAVGGKGADWEGHHIIQELYDSKNRATKFVPILFDRTDEQFIPEPLRGSTHYLLNSEENYQGLYRFLTDRAGVPPGGLGPLKLLALPAAEPLRFLINNLPFASNPAFTGREEELRNLQVKFQKGEQHSGILTVVVHGLGGVGKTQLAVEYAWKNPAQYKAVLWVQADNPETLGDSLSELLSVLDLPGGREKEKALQVKAVMRWLRDNQGWLLIADNVDTDAAVAAVQEQFTPSLPGDLMITSRDNRWSVTARHLDLKCLLPEAAAGFLQNRMTQAGHHAGDDTSALAVAHALGYLPLALEQAAALMIELRSPPDARVVATVLDNLGTVLQQTGQFRLAEPLHTEALRLKTETLGPDHPGV